MIDLWLKAFHLMAIVLWLGGMVFALAAFVQGDGGARQLARKLNAVLTTPAMFAVWALGIALAQQGDWWTSGWLQVKLVLVVILSAVHGILSGRLAQDQPAGGRALAAGFAVFPIIILLAVLKPF